jgi:NAD+ kinase
MKKIIVIADQRKSEVKSSLDKVLQCLENIADVKGCFSSPQEMKVSLDNKPDYLVILGGDGFVLWTARSTARYAIPIIGVNFGKLGFLTEFTVTEIYEGFAEVLEGKHQLTQRIMLFCRVFRDNKVVFENHAVNEGAIKSKVVSRMIYTSLTIDKAEAICFGGDGIIVSTPVGSTAYSLSAGGALLYPTLSALSITPICPHVLTIRPFVIPSHCEIEISFFQPYFEEAILTLDGQIHFDLEKEDRVVLSQATENFSLVTPQNRTFFQVLREKLVWGENSVCKR